MTQLILWMALAAQANTPSRCDRLLSRALSGHTVSLAEVAGYDLRTAGISETFELGPFAPGVYMGHGTDSGGNSHTVLFAPVRGQARQAPGAPDFKPRESRGPIVFRLDGGKILRLYDPDSFNVQSKIEARILGLAEIDSASVSKDGAVLAAADQQGRVIISPVNKLDPRAHGHTGTVLGHLGHDALVVTPNGKLLRVSPSGQPVALELELGTIGDPTGHTHLVAVHEATEQLALDVYGRLVLVDFRRGHTSGPAQFIPEEVVLARFSNDGTQLAWIGELIQDGKRVTHTTGVADIGKRQVLTHHRLGPQGHDIAPAGPSGWLIAAAGAPQLHRSGHPTVTLLHLNSEGLASLAKVIPSVSANRPIIDRSLALEVAPDGARISFRIEQDAGNGPQSTTQPNFFVTELTAVQGPPRKRIVRASGNSSQVFPRREDTRKNPTESDLVPLNAEDALAWHLADRPSVSNGQEPITLANGSTAVIDQGTVYILTQDVAESREWSDPAALPLRLTEGPDSTLFVYFKYASPTQSGATHGLMWVERGQGKFLLDVRSPSFEQVPVASLDAVQPVVRDGHLILPIPTASGVLQSTVFKIEYPRR